MSEIKEKAKPEPTYELKGIPVHVYLTETGEFGWIPATQACDNKEAAEEMLQVLKKMPEDRRAVWGSRLDSEQAKARCPVILEEPDLCKEFDAFCAAYRSPEKAIEERKEKGK